MVDMNIVESKHDQRCYYNSGTCVSRAIGAPAAHTLDPCWTGPWTVTKLKSPLTVAIQKGGAMKIEHVNHLHPLLETLVDDGSD